MTRMRQIVIGLVACVVVAAAAIVATQVGTGTTSGSDPKTVSSAAAHRQNPQRHHSRDGGQHGTNPYRPSPVIGGGRMLPPGGGVTPGSVLSPNTGGWAVASHARNTYVEAGADANHPSDGMFSITRTSYIHGTQSGDVVRVAGSGALTITKAPLGRKIVVSAQKRGNLEFKSRSGITGTLHLKDDTVTLNP